MKIDNSKICFVLIAGFSSDSQQIWKLGDVLKLAGYSVAIGSFYGETEVDDFAALTERECINNISALINKAANNFERVYGIGISLGGALLLEYAKKEDGLSGIVSVGTPFLLRNISWIRFGMKFFPIIYPAWKHLQRIKKLRLSPIGAVAMAVNYMEGKFLENLDKITTPTLFLHSKKDTVTDYRVLEKYVSLLSAAKHKTIYFNNGNHVIDDNPMLIVKHTADFFGLEFTLV
jgi:esterase/lipase